MSNNMKRYKYNILRVLLTILLLPYILIKSNKYFKSFKDFCYTYPKFGRYEGNNEYYKQIPTDTNTLEYHYWDLKKMNIKINSFQKNELVEFSLETKKGTISCLKAQVNNSNKWAIGLHGWTEDKYLALRLVRHYYENGYNILTFDAYAHGKSYGKFTDIGYSSIEMIDEIINFISKENEVKSIGLIGNSMGASTSVFYSQTGKYKNKINWVISDCGFSNIKLQYRYYIQNNLFKKPWWLISLGFIKKFSKITKTNQNKYNLLKLMKLNSTTPILFVHGKGDSFISYEMSLDLYNYKIKKETSILSDLWTPDGSKHVYLISDYHKEYLERTLVFSKSNN
ncbi:hypothetical protein SCORR_v1c06440 [Spiroplasma corruscae]|uniref:AB hydrolase-1 domain-containing protein n=1 Tax=Spiroplasma corruscae TaxID=216934 RepID=A0A222EPP7_9MOLU|nr:alpha/beta hydrolase [Spiroplasma corruscae]ASP28416.1 hypothetical protein SCORR_v1c06440 [Spiroplasma corruscae]